MADQQISIPITPSEPPSVRLVAARGAAWQMVIAQFAELIGLVAITYALVSGKLGEQTFAYLFCGCLSGRFAQQVGSAIRGKPVPPLPTTTLVSMAAVFALAVTLGAAQAALEAIDHAMATQAPGPGTGDRESAPKEQAGPGPAEGGGPPNAAAPANAAAAPVEGAP